MTKQEEREQRLEKVITPIASDLYFYYLQEFSGNSFLASSKVDEYIGLLNTQIDSEIDLAIAEERKRIVEMIRENWGKGVSEKDYNDLISLINKDN